MSTAAIIVTFNGSNWIRPCLTSCLASAEVTEVVVVDNGSDDETCTIVAKEFPEVTLIRLGKNMGFGYANNIGMAHALTKKPDGIMLVNQDATLDGRCVKLLERASAANPEFGLFSPMHLNYAGTGIHRGFLKYLVMSCKSLIDDCMLSKRQNLYEFSNAPAALWWMPHRVLEKVGGFDPLFFVYCEDADYVNRVLEAGFRCALIPEAIGRHDDSPSRLSLAKEFELWFSQQLILLKYSKTLKRDVLRVMKRVLVCSAQALTSFDLARLWQIVKVVFRLYEKRRWLLRSRSLLSNSRDYCFLPIEPRVASTPVDCSVVASRDVPEDQR